MVFHRLEHRDRPPELETVLGVGARGVDAVVCRARGLCRNEHPRQLLGNRVRTAQHAFGLGARARDRDVRDTTGRIDPRLHSDVDAAIDAVDDDHVVPRADDEDVGEPATEHETDVARQ